MTRQPQDLLVGNWRPGESVDQVDAHTAVEWHGYQTYSHRGVVAYAKSSGSTLHLGVGRPGMHSLWYGEANGRVFWHEHRWALMQQLRKAGAKGSLTKQVEAGTVVEWDYQPGEGLQPARVVEVEPLATALTQQMDLPTAAGYLWDGFLAATEEMYDLAGKPRITALASAGTDSTMGILALREIGADIHAVSVGRSLDDFDPKYAERYMKHLGVPFELIVLPESTEELRQLAYDTISAIEYSEMSNTLMAMCTTLVRRWAIANDRPCMWKGHYADDLLGTNNATYGAFRKKFPQQTDQQWTDFRAGMYQHIIPNDLQVAQVCRRGETFWRSTFYHPTVAEFVWSCPRAVVPTELRKPLFQAVCDRFIGDLGSWHDQPRKVGYYSGSGIGKIRLENDVLSDESFRAIYKQAKAALT